jgi:hypothetical protein
MRTGLRWWVVFCRVLGLHYFLFEGSDLPLSYDLKSQIEYKLLMFMAYLGRVRKPKVLKGRVIAGYCGHVKSMHAKVACGRAFADVCEATARLTTMGKVLQAWRPSDTRMKVAFNVAHFKIFSRTVDAMKEGSTLDVRFLLDRVRMAVAVMLTAVLRSSEICDNKDCAAANRSPIWLADVVFKNTVADEEVVSARRMDGTIAAGSSFATSKMPPSKMDRVQRVGNDLYFPGMLPESNVKGAKECIEDFVNDYPVMKHLQPVVPLFRTVRQGAASQMTRSMFLHDFKIVCRAAKAHTGTELWYSQWGTHAFRVGGMNALQDAGASVAQIMALGHWKSDAWLLYSRRNRPQLMYWSRQILGPAASARAAQEVRRTDQEWSLPDDEIEEIDD